MLFRSKAVAAREFREDLFYRLNVVRIPIPPLRERKEDIPLLVNYFLRTLARNQNQPPKSITPEVVAALQAYRWPGNVRELENVIRRAQVVAKGDAVLTTDMPPEVMGRGASLSASTPATAPTGAAPGAPPDLKSLALVLFRWAAQDPKLKIIPAVERELIIHALAETKGNQVQAAKLLGITRATLRKRVEKFSIKQELHVK